MKLSKSLFLLAQAALTSAVPMNLFSSYLRSGYEAHDNLNKLKVIIYETGPYSTSLQTFMDVADKYGVEAIVVGQGSTFSGFGSKYGQLKDSLNEYKNDPQALVAVIDGRDVLLNVNNGIDPDAFHSRINEFIEGFKQLVDGKPRAVLMSAEQQCCVAALCHADSPSFYFDPVTGQRAQRACPSGEEGCGWLDNENVKFWQSLMVAEAYTNTGSQEISPYLNAGLMAGTAQNLIDMIDRMDLGEEEDDQAVLSAMYLQFPELIVLDYEQKLLGNNAWPKGLEEGCIYDFDEKMDDKLFLNNTQTGTSPLILHTPGKFYDCLDLLIDRLGGVSDMRYLNEEERNMRKMQENYGTVSAGTVIDTSEPTAAPVDISDLARGEPLLEPPAEDSQPSGALTLGLSCAAAGILIAGLAARRRKTMTEEEHANMQRAIDDSDEAFSVADPKLNDDLPSVISSVVDEAADPDAMELQAMSHQPFNSTDEAEMVDVPVADNDETQIKSILSSPFDSCTDMCGRQDSEDLRRNRTVQW